MLPFELCADGRAIALPHVDQPIVVREPSLAGVTTSVISHSLPVSRPTIKGHRESVDFVSALHAADPRSLVSWGTIRYAIILCEKIESLAVVLANAFHLGICCLREPLLMWFEHKGWVVRHQGVQVNQDR